MTDNGKYRVNEIFASIAGEGVRTGIPHLFVRFSGCNMACSFCDTEFESGRQMTAEEILAECCNDSHGSIRNVLFCGGEPLLQLDQHLIETFRNDSRPWFLAAETNGSCQAPEGLDWITCSPKVAEHALKLQTCNELKYVRARGQAIPQPRIKADHYLISPMFQGDRVDRATIDHCVGLVKANPEWRLTFQAHKFLGVR